MKDSSRARAGCSTVRRAASAIAFTGEGCNFKARPFGRSGCVTTATTLKWASLVRAIKLAQASSAVPMKMIRKCDIGQNKGSRALSRLTSTAQQTPGRLCAGPGCRSGVDGRAGDFTFTQGSGAAGTEILVQFAARQHQQ